MKKILLLSLSILFLAACTQPVTDNKEVIPSTEVGETSKLEVPNNCTSWFDGCNTCGAKDGNLTMCTLKFCEKNTGEPKCLAFEGDNTDTENPAKSCLGIHHDRETGKRSKKEFKEGEYTNCIIMPDGREACIADATHYCRDGKWEIEGNKGWIEPGLIQDPKEKACTKEYKPVCGMIDTGIRCISEPCPSSEKKTFGNNCMAENAGAEILHKGECKEENMKSAEIPENCTNWFDGCNNCKVMPDGGLACTKKFCQETEEPKCTKFKE